MHIQQIVGIKRESLWVHHHDKMVKSIFFEFERGVRLLVFSASSPEMERLACRFLYSNFAPGRVRALFLATMIVNEQIFPGTSASKLFREYGVEKSKEQFGCWPLLEIPKASLLKKIEPKYLSIYGYLAQLTKKKIYTVANTSAIIRNFIKDDVLKISYTTLADFGLLDNVEKDTWTHKNNAEAIECRALMAQVIAIEKFFYWVERTTWDWREKVEESKECNRRLRFIKNPNHRLSPCPACSFRNYEDVECADETVLSPFHYRCGYFPELIDFSKLGSFDIPFDEIEKIERVSPLESEKVEFKILLKTGEVILKSLNRYSKIFGFFAKDIKRIEQKMRSKQKIGIIKEG